jgi:hypothetical protein
MAEEDNDEIVFYADVIKVHVLPETGSFTIQIMTSDLTVEIDFADADTVREALELFETKKVLEVSSVPPGSVRIIPSLEKKEGPKNYREPFIKPESHGAAFEQMPARPGRTSKRELARHSEALAKN